MVSALPADFYQLLRPIPAVGQDIEFTGNGKLKVLDHLLGHRDFSLETAAAFGPSGVIELCPEGEERSFIEQGGQHPLVAKEIGQVLGMVFMPGTSRDLLAGLLHEGIVHQKKEGRVGFNPEGLEEAHKGDRKNFLHRPGIFSQKASKTGEGALQEGAAEGSNQRGGMSFLSQLDEADHKGGEKFKRRA